MDYAPYICIGVAPQLVCTSDVILLGVMQLRVGGIEFIVKYLPVITGKTCATVVNMKALFASSLRYLPLAEMKRTLPWFDGTFYSQIEYLDNNSTVSNIVRSLLSTIFITLYSHMFSHCDIHDSKLVCVLSLSYSQLCPSAHPLAVMFTIGTSWAPPHCDVRDDIQDSTFVRDPSL